MDDRKCISTVKTTGLTSIIKTNLRDVFDTYILFLKIEPNFSVSATLSYDNKENIAKKRPFCPKIRAWLVDLLSSADYLHQSHKEKYG